MNKEVYMKLFLLSFLIFSHVFAAPVKEPPTREVAVIVTKEGYYPRSLSVFEGERIKFFVTSTLEEPN